MLKKSRLLRQFNILLPILFAALLASCSSVPIKTRNYHSVDQDTAKAYALYAMISSNAYQDMESLRFPLEKIGWNLIYSISDDSGLAYDILEDENSDEVIFAYRGTESLDFGDWFTNSFIVSPQPEIAYSALKTYIKNHPRKHITLTGHSLGGGLAIGMSLRLDLDAVVFNSSPRFFDGFGLGIWGWKDSNHAKRVAIFQKGEVLEFVRSLSVLDNHKQIVPDENIFEASFNLKECNNSIDKPICNHSMNLLAFELLKIGKHHEHLSVIWEAIENCK